MRRGELSMTMLVAIIMAAIVGVLLIIFAVRATKPACNGDVQACRATVLAAHFGEKLGIRIPQQCTGKTISFTDEEPEEVNKILSRELEKCVFKFHEGQLNFNQGKLLGPFSDRMLCFRCATFDFSEYRKNEAYLQESAAGRDLGAYQNQHDTICSRPKRPLSSYLEELSRQVSRKERYLLPNPVAKVEPPQQYILFAMLHKKGVTATWAEMIWGKLLGLSGNVTVPAEVALVPSTDAALRECEVFFQ